MNFWGWLAVFVVAKSWVPLGLCGLFIALWITQDYRKRCILWDLTRDLDDSTLRDIYAAAMIKVATHRQSPSFKALKIRDANLALVLATVLREHAFHRAGISPAPTYLRSRRDLLRQAKRLAL